MTVRCEIAALPALGAAGILLVVTATCCAEDAIPQRQPVILLTGFEPFGPARPPNPSWE